VISGYVKWGDQRNQETRDAPQFLMSPWFPLMLLPYAAEIPAYLNYSAKILLRHCGKTDIFINMKKRLQPVNSGTERERSSSKESLSRQENLLFPIVGIGASDGGREALEQFIINILITVAFFPDTLQSDNLK
jgi:hypothetical protein